MTEEKPDIKITDKEYEFLANCTNIEFQKFCSKRLRQLRGLDA